MDKVKEKLEDASQIENMLEKRKEAGLSQVAVAKYCGVSLQAYVRWENGTTKGIKKKHYDKLREILNVKSS